MGCNPRAVIKQTANRIEVIADGKVVEKFAIPAPGKEPCEQCVRDGLEVVERVLARYRPVNVPGLPRFTGGAVGFIGYEFIHDVEPIVPRPPKDELGTPTLYFLIADELLIFDRAQQTITILVNAVLTMPRRPPRPTSGRSRRLTGLSRCWNSRWRTCPPHCPTKSRPRRSNPTR